MTTCVVGVGNLWAGDDGAGPEILRQLDARLHHEPPLAGDEIACMVLPSPPVGLIDVMADCERLIVVDAVVSGAEPGTVHRLEWHGTGLEARAVERASSHGLGLREVLELAQALGRRPSRVVLLGIEVASTVPGRSLSPQVAASVPAIVAQLYDEILAGT